MVSARGKQIRADAHRNRDAIIGASLSALGGNPDATVGTIAAAAGISRSTLYAHFPSRRVLVEAAFRGAMSLLDHGFAHLDPALPAGDAMERLVTTSSGVLGCLAGIVSAASQEVDRAQLSRMTAESLAGIQKLLERGRSDSVFRTDQDVEWQAQCVIAIAQAGTTRVSSGCPQPTVTREMTSTPRAMLAAARADSA